MLGQPADALNCLAEAAQIVETTDERVGEAELLHRVPGDLLNAAGHQSAAEQNYHQAIGVAERQSAKLLQLRASTSLARLWRDQCKRAEARDLLCPIQLVHRGFRCAGLEGREGAVGTAHVMSDVRTSLAGISLGQYADAFEGPRLGLSL